MGAGASFSNGPLESDTARQRLCFVLRRRLYAKIILSDTVVDDRDTVVDDSLPIRQWLERVKPGLPEQMIAARRIADIVCCYKVLDLRCKDRDNDNEAVLG